MSVYLDGRMSSLLDFREARIDALRHIAKGEKILWELDLGFLSGLKHPLGNEMESRSMVLAFDHFIKSLWQEFSQYSLGLSLYRGPLETAFDDDPYKSQAQFADFLRFLVLNAPDNLPLFLHFEDTYSHPLKKARLSNRELFDRFQIFLNGVLIEPGTSEQALLLPSAAFSGCYEALEKFITTLDAPFRIIPEPNLTIEWDGLNTLFVAEKALSPSGIRMVKGFQAAGGQVVPVD